MGSSGRTRLFVSLVYLFTLLFQGLAVGPARSDSGRALRVRVRGVGPDGRERSHTMEARALRGALGVSVIRSTMFEIRKHDDEIVIVGSGHGHGVGMSQWGAEAMAQRGDGYRQILSAFYPGVKLERASRWNRGGRP